MTAFRDTRNDDFYNQDFLDEMDKQFVAGYDCAVEELITLFEGNLDVYEGDCDTPTGGTLFDLIERNKENNKFLIEMIHDGAEMQRDTLITSMIDGMDEETFKKLRAEALEKNKGKKEYYDTLHYAFRGEKVFREE